MDDKSLEVLTGRVQPHLAIRLPKDLTLAETMYERVKQQLEEFQEELTSEEEIGVCLANFGREQVISVDAVGFHNPHLIIFVGTNEKGYRVKLVQHMSQVSLMLVAVPAQHRPARRVGFEGSEK